MAESLVSPPPPVERAMSEPRFDNYKVFRAAADLRLFTVRDLAGSTGVDTAYIHKLISGLKTKGWVEQLEPIPAPRGRPPVRYQIVPGGHAQLRQELDALLRELAPLRRTTAPPPAPALLAAENDLFDRLPAVRSLDDLRALLANVALIVDGPLAPPNDPRWETARVLLRLADLALAVYCRSRVNWVVELARLTFQLGRLYVGLDEEYRGAVEAWLTDSPVGRFLKDPRVPLFGAALVDLFLTDGPGVRAVVDGVIRAAKAATPRLEIRRHTTPGAAAEPAAGTRAVLVACDSQPAGPVRADLDRLFEAVARWGQTNYPVYVLDAEFSSDVQQKVLSLKAAGYVPDADRLEAAELIQAVPALAVSDGGVCPG